MIKIRQKYNIDPILMTRQSIICSSGKHRDNKNISTPEKALFFIAQSERGKKSRVLVQFPHTSYTIASSNLAFERIPFSHGVVCLPTSARSRASTSEAESEALEKTRALQRSDSVVPRNRSGPHQHSAPRENKLRLRLNDRPTPVNKFGAQLPARAVVKTRDRKRAARSSRLRWPSPARCSLLLAGRQK